MAVNSVFPVAAGLAMILGAYLWFFWAKGLLRSIVAASLFSVGAAVLIVHLVRSL